MGAIVKPFVFPGINKVPSRDVKGEYHQTLSLLDNRNNNYNTVALASSIFTERKFQRINFDYTNAVLEILSNVCLEYPHAKAIDISEKLHNVIRDVLPRNNSDIVLMAALSFVHVDFINKNISILSSGRSLSGIVIYDENNKSNRDIDYIQNTSNLSALVFSPDLDFGNSRGSKMIDIEDPTKIRAVILAQGIGHSEYFKSESEMLRLKESSIPELTNRLLQVSSDNTFGFCGFTLER